MVMGSVLFEATIECLNIITANYGFTWLKGFQSRKHLRYKFPVNISRINKIYKEVINVY
jgi:hypothetical protein